MNEKCDHQIHHFQDRGGKNKHLFQTTTSLYYQPKRCTNPSEIPQNYHTLFASSVIAPQNENII